MMPSVVSCNILLKDVVLVHYNPHELDSPHDFGLSQLSYSTGCLFESQVTICVLVCGCAANTRYSFCEVILQVRLGGRTHRKLDRTPETEL